MVAWFSLRRVGQGLCATPILVAPLLGGTAGRPYTMIVAALCGLAAAWVGVAEHRKGRRLWVSWFGVALLWALLLTLLQLVPLPPGLRAALAPGSDGLLRQILGEQGGYPHRPHPLSLDPSATLNEAVRLGGYLCLLLALAPAFSRRGEGALLQRVVCAAAGLVAVAGLGAALGAPLPAPLLVAGVGTRAKLAAGFVNSNHMAALLGIGAILTLSAAEEARGAQRTLLLLLLALLNVGLLGTLSRGGIAVGLLGQAAVLLWPLVAGRGGRPGGGLRRRALLLLGAPVVAVVLGLVFAREASTELQARIEATRLSELATPGSKVRAWIECLPLLRGHLPMGVGRGAFENAFQSVNSLSGNTRFAYLENEWLQAVADWGVPGAAALLLLLGLGLRDGVRRLGAEQQRGRQGGRRVAALVAIVAVALHNLVDFNLEVGGVAAAVAALLALAARGRFPISPLWLSGLAAIVLVAAPLVQARVPDHDEEGRALLLLAERPEVAAEALLRAGAAAAGRHPLDSYLPAIIGSRLLQLGRPEAISWLNRSLLANPNDVGAMRGTALLLGARGYPAQAAVTLRHVIARATWEQRQQLYQAALQIARSPEGLLEALPPSPQIGEEMLNFLATRSAPRWPLVRQVGLWAEHLGDEGAPQWLAQAALAERDPDAAVRWADRLLRGSSPPMFLLANLAGMLLDAGRAADAEALCRRALKVAPATEISVSLALLEERRGALTEARRLLDSALEQASGPEEKARAHEARAGLEERQGNLERAQEDRRRAARWRDGG